MPGRLIMEQQGAVGSHDFKKDRAKAQEAGLPPKPDFPQKQGAPPVSAPDSHAVNGSLPNGSPAQGQHPPTTNGDVTTGTMATSNPQSPPPLDQSWREAPSNKSMGKLIQRLAQTCFEDLNTTLTKMSEIPVEPQSVQPNGVTSQAVDTSEASLSKKRTFMEFANGQRDRFIKTLVLSDWARNSEDMARLVDIKVMHDQRNFAQEQSINNIGHLKHEVNRIKIPNPNIDLAMELLATGKAAKQPHLGYIAQKKLSAKETLKTLRNMNVLLETRLNLHEELPPHFNDFSVANGKATFRVPGEFEVDLAIADEDLTSPFYFINMRFIFSPSSGDLHDTLRPFLESKTNDVLASKGLQGCYEFLHNFALTHKINTLYNQARQIEREKWFGCVFIQKSRRVLTVQYWRDTPGKKSWFEIAVSTGKQPGRRSRRPATPRLSVRWFRRGELVKDHDMHFDWQTLNLERILRTVIARHVRLLLSAARERLLTLAGASSKLDMEWQSPEDSPEDSCLKLSLPGIQTPLTVKLGTITGHISMSPATIRSADMEMRLNKQADPDIAVAVANLLCNTVKDRVDKAAELAGWSLFREPIRTDNFKAVFGTDVPSWRAFVPTPGWVSQDSQWLVFAIFSLTGEKWWVVRVEEKASTSQAQPVRSITAAREICVKAPVAGESVPTISRGSLLRIEKLAAAEVSFAVLSQQLASEKITYQIQKTSSLTSEDSKPGSLPISAILINTRDLLQVPNGRPSPLHSVKVSNQGFVSRGLDGDNAAQMGHELHLTMEDNKLNYLRAWLKRDRRNPDIAMNASSGLALRLHAPFGKPFFEQIKRRLEACDRLDSSIKLLHSLNMRPVIANLTQLAFHYCQADGLTAAIAYRDADDKSLARLKLVPERGNPQRRLRMDMERLLNSSSANSFDLLCLGLKYTLPVMRFFEKLEAADADAQESVIEIMNALEYRITYKAPLPAWTFRIELFSKRQDNGFLKCLWRIDPDKDSTTDEMRSSAFGQALAEFSKHKDDKWIGFGKGSVSTLPDRAVHVLEKLDKLVRSFKGDGDGAATKPADGKSTQQPAVLGQQKSAPTNTNATKAAPAKTNASSAPSRNGSNNQSSSKKEVIELD